MVILKVVVEVAEWCSEKVERWSKVIIDLVILILAKMTFFCVGNTAKKSGKSSRVVL